MKKIMLFVLLFATNLFSQKLELFPGELNIQPFTANSLEPKLGFLFQLSKNELRLDIGNSIDVLHYNDDNVTWSFGADLFTYTLLRGEKDFHFPVDAVDYLFGINGSFKKKVADSYEYGTRVRISHISAHFVDGHYDGSKGQWRDGLNPRVYSREFLEIMPFVNFNSLRFHGGFTYLFHVTPDFLGKNSYQIGFDYFAKEYLFENLTPFLGYDLKLVKIHKYSANHSFITGIKFGKPESRGLSVYFNFYSGKSIHGEYFDFNKTYSALGINLDL